MTFSAQQHDQSFIGAGMIPHNSRSAVHPVMGAAAAPSKMKFKVGTGAAVSAHTAKKTKKPLSHITCGSGSRRETGHSAHTLP